MKKNKVYISIPMTGHDMTDQESRSRAIEQNIINAGAVAVNPFDISKEVDKCFHPHEPEYNDYLSADLTALSECNSIYLCRGWHTSKGCRVELKHALLKGIDVIVEE